MPETADEDPKPDSSPLLVNEHAQGRKTESSRCNERIYARWQDIILDDEKKKKKQQPPSNGSFASITGQWVQSGRPQNDLAPLL